MGELWFWGTLQQQTVEAGDYENDPWSLADLFFLWYNVGQVTTSVSFCLLGRDVVLIAQGFVMIKRDKACKVLAVWLGTFYVLIGR